MNALVFGLGHHILPRSIDEMSIKAQIESQIETICKGSKCQLSYDNKTKLREATDSFIHEGKQICNTRKNRAIHNTLKTLSNNSKIKCCKMDKGVGIVVLDTEDYFSKLDVIIEDKTRFSKTTYDLKKASNVSYCDKAPWVEKERSIIRYMQKYLAVMVEKEDITKSTYLKVYPTGSQPGRLYGMAKNHKKNCPLRPVLSAVNTPEYAFSKWLESHIKPHYKSKWSVSSTQAFVTDLNSIKPKVNDVCVSFDIKSLYTNVPLNEVINDVANAMYDEENNTIFYKHRNNLSCRVFKNMMRKCSENIFLYKDGVYKQIDGLSMGSPLAPILANWFVAGVEEKILDDPTIKQPKFYRRYVDDIFAVFESTQDRDVFYNRLNSAHKSLEFTMEKVNTSTNSLPFLDVDISISQSNEFEMKVYRKPTNTNVVMNYEAMAPRKWKQSVIKCFLSRASRVTSSDDLFDQEVTRIKETFEANGYPRGFVDKTIAEYRSAKSKDGQMELSATEVPEDNNTAKEYYFVLPYIGKASERFQRRMKKELLEHDIKVRPAYRTTKVGSYFCLKSSIPSLFKADVVYRFQCPYDEGNHQSIYIGETQRQFFQRISEHCPATSKSTSSTSAVYDHIVKCDHCQNTSNIINCFTILRSSSGNNVFAEEALCIRKFRPSLNIQLGPFKGSRMQTRIFN